MAIFGLPGGAEWIIILAIILLLFGPSQLPKLAKMFGKSAKSLKEGLEGNFEDDETETATKDKAAKASEDASEE